jgi:hypothetical protein
MSTTDWFNYAGRRERLPNPRVTCLQTYEVIGEDDETVPRNARCMLVRATPSGFVYRTPVFPDEYVPTGTVAPSRLAHATEQVGGAPPCEPPLEPQSPPISDDDAEGSREVP